VGAVAKRAPCGGGRLPLVCTTAGGPPAPPATSCPTGGPRGRRATATRATTRPMRAPRSQPHGHHASHRLGRPTGPARLARASRRGTARWRRWAGSACAFAPPRPPAPAPRRAPRRHQRHRRLAIRVKRYVTCNYTFQDGAGNAVSRFTSSNGLNSQLLPLYRRLLALGVLSLGFCRRGVSAPAILALLAATCPDS